MKEDKKIKIDFSLPFIIVYTKVNKDIYKYLWL